MKKILTLVATLVVSGLTAQAGFLDCGPIRWGSVKNTNYQCVSVDKIFSEFAATTAGPNAPVLADTGVLDTWDLKIGEFVTDQHYITLTPSSSSISGGAVPVMFGISYRIDVDTANFPSKRITSVDIDATLVGGDPKNQPQVRTAQKWVYDLTGALLGAGQAGTPFVGPDSFNIPASKSIRIQEVITLQNSTLTGFTDAYTQSSIPEPATYGMMGLGLAALGLLARRKKA